MGRVSYRTKWRLGDGWSLLALLLIAGSACAWLGWAIDRDETAAEQARSRHAATVLVGALQALPEGPWEARAPTLTQLAHAVGPQVQLAVVAGTPDQAQPFFGNRAFEAHSDPQRNGQRLDPARPDDAWLLQRLRAWQGDRRKSVSSEWDQQSASAFLAAGTPPVALAVTGVAPPPAAHRAWSLAGGAFAVIVVLGAALMGWARQLGPWLVVPVMTVTLWVTALLGAELDATLWVGRAWKPACHAVSETGFPAVARALCASLPPEPSLVARSTLACVLTATLLYLAWLVTRLVLAWRRARREAVLARVAV